MVIHESIHERIIPLLVDPVPEVRGAAVVAFESVVRYETAIMTLLLACIRDASSLVRKELIIALSRFISEYHSKILKVAIQLLEEEKKQIRNTIPAQRKRFSYDSSTTVYGWAVKRKSIWYRWLNLEHYIWCRMEGSIDTFS